MKCFLSGCQAATFEREKLFIESGWFKWRCFSFASVHKIPGLPYLLPGSIDALKVCEDNNVEIMMDSGVIGWRSFRANCEKSGNKKALDKLCTGEQFIQLYVDYVKKNQHKWDIYITIDFARIAKEIYERHVRIEEMGIRPVPVYHGDDDAETYLKKYADLGHTLIAIGTTKATRTGVAGFRTYLHHIFNIAAKLGLQLHGLAFTAPWVMMQYPWYSVDSSSWSRVAGFGGIMMFDENNHRLTNVNISNEASKTINMQKLNTGLMQKLKEETEADGFDFAQLRDDFVQRHIYNAKTMYRMAEYATKRHATGNHKKVNLMQFKPELTHA